MNEKDLEKFLSDISGEYFVFAPQKEGDVLRVKKLDYLDDLDLSPQIPINSWKEVFLPPHEVLFNISKAGLTETNSQIPKAAAFGVNILDLKALALFDQVFSDDKNYQKRRRNTLVIGYSSQGLEEDYKKFKVSSHNFEENILEHIPFDIFFIKRKSLMVYSGSQYGQEILDKFGINKYKHVEFAGAISEEGPDKRMLSLLKKVDKSIDKKVWNDLDKICLACGKCSIACPTCFCFDINDRNDPIKAERTRKWGVCFYNDFTKVAGGHKPLDTVKKKIYFWYTHKFVRIPHEYKLPGCVSCGRCSRVCPVDIKIKEVLKRL